MSTFEIFITPRAWHELKALPGNMRQRLRRDIDQLASTPRPSASKVLVWLQSSEEKESQAYELRRLRVDRWRVVYAITEDNKTIMS